MANVRDYAVDHDEKLKVVEVMAKNKSNGFGITSGKTSFVLGLIGLFLVGIPLSILAIIFGLIGLFLFGIPLGILAIIFGRIGLGKKQRFALVGLILGIVDLLGALIFVTIIKILFG